MTPDNDARILDAWKKNAARWAAAVRERRIESRERVTNRAVIDAVLRCAPASVLDVGCGEGWLVRELTGRVTRAVGVDVVPDLVERAGAAGGGQFLVASFEEIAGGSIEGVFDVVVCNFSLLGKAPVDALFRAFPSLLNPGGQVVVQTLHPLAACGDLPYADGWRAGSWDGCGPGFTDPAPWYFRTIASWIRLFSASGLGLLELREPVHPDTGRPASIIFVGSAADGGAQGRAP